MWFVSLESIIRDLCKDRLASQLRVTDDVLCFSYSFHHHPRNLESIIEDLQHDPWPTPSDSRVARCGGAALSVAVGLLETSFARQGARIMMFTGGPTTVGAHNVHGRRRAGGPS
jgi:hypothetical protein